MRKWSTAQVYGMLGTDVATIGTVDMWLYRCTSEQALFAIMCPPISP